MPRTLKSQTIPAPGFLGGSFRLGAHRGLTGRHRNCSCWTSVIAAALLRPRRGKLMQACVPLLAPDCIASSSLRSADRPCGPVDLAPLEPPTRSLAKCRRRSRVRLFRARLCRTVGLWSLRWRSVQCLSSGYIQNSELTRCCRLYGITILQTYIYYDRYGGDSVYIKLFVSPNV